MLAAAAAVVQLPIIAAGTAVSSGAACITIRRSTKQPAVQDVSLSWQHVGKVSGNNL